MSESNSNDTLTIKKHTLWMFSTFILAALVIVLLIVNFTGGNGTVTGNVVNTNPTNPTAPTQPVMVKASADDDARWGDEDAPVEIIEFSDFQCPFCSRALPTLEQIKAQYGDDVTIVYRDLPLTSIHPMAQKAAEAAECVQEAGGDEAFWEYHDTLFANQAALSNDNLKAWAKTQGYDISNCLDSGKFASEVQKDSADAQAATCTGTPCFIVMDSDGNGQKVNGAVPFEQFKPIIDAALA